MTDTDGIRAHLARRRGVDVVEPPKDDVDDAWVVASAFSS